MTNLSMNELIEMYAYARDKMHNDNSDYWKGVMHTVQKMLNIMYGGGVNLSGWTMQGTRGYFVFYEGMKYDDAREKEFEWDNSVLSMSDRLYNNN
jgi:hypothetical protein